MANHQSALKRIRQTERRTARNRVIRSAMRTQIKKVRALAEAGDKPAAQEALASAIVKIDKACTKGIIHSNQASRRVSRLTLLVNGL